VIVVRVNAGGSEKTAGVVVDAVSEVYSVAPANVKPAPGQGSSMDDACVRGLTSVDGKMVMLLDINRLVASCIAAPAARNESR
jgi:purine-binding chemotaxis protein CheW